MPDCLFVTALPPELRLHIYSYLLTFDQPIKLRIIVPGDRDLAILRVNRQIHREAIDALYGLNTIAICRNDFCQNTDAYLQTPLNHKHARHLLITSFHRSVACTLLDTEERCGVCQPSAYGLLRILEAMPRLKTAMVGRVGNHSEIEMYRQALEQTKERYAFDLPRLFAGRWSLQLMPDYHLDA